ncbi:MAG: GatB/YqeY domain-containing protein [Patescibacteria group bacterium]|nr:GatB/YqeY domain-containing protein [Patescibacteria group bacterium]
MLKQKLQEEQIIALKSGDKEKLSTLRFVLAQIKNKEIEKQEELNDDEIILIIKKITKELKESIDSFKKAGRKDLIDESERQLKIISLYLPEELTDDQLKQEIEKIISQNKELFNKNPKAIIGICMKSLKAKADSSRIMKIIQIYVKN